MRLPYLLACSLILALSPCDKLEAKSKKLPAWLEEASERPTPPRRDDEKPGFEVVWDEAHYEVLKNGQVHKKIRFAIRIIDLKERWRARAKYSYASSSSTRPKMKAWTLHADGEVHKYKRIDEKESRNSSYLTIETEVKTVTIDGWSETRTGDIFAFECESTESTIFTQYYWRFQNQAPVSLSRLSVTIPEDWSIEETYFGATPNKSKAGQTVTWEEQNVLSKEWEPHSPSSAAKHEHMRIALLPPEGSRLRFSHLNFNTWQDLSKFTARVSDPMAEPTREIEAKAHELTKDAQSDWEKIQAIGEFAKSINYEHVALDLGNGGGYTPRPAGETFRVAWGDCKDKSTLLRSLLKSVGIDSYVVSLNATDNDWANERLPGPFYFDHCITAVEVDESIDTPATYQDPNLGRLLFIDPTWPNSPIGEIPFEAQGGLALVAKNISSPLVRLPLSTPEQNKAVRSIVAELMPDGTILGRVDTTRHGQSAVNERRLISNRNRNEYLQTISDRYALASNPSPIVKVIEEKDDFLGDRTYRNTVDFGFKGYAKQMQNVLMVFKPAIIGRLVDNPFSEAKRTLPVRLRSEMMEETAQIYIPYEYELDEFQEEISIETDFGSYRATVAEVPGESELSYTRVFKILDVEIPANRYDELREFYAQVVDAEQTPIVLSRKLAEKQVPTVSLQTQ